ncbi:MAG: EF-hand domain-containing protein [Sphingomonadales bacterium]
MIISAVVLSMLAQAPTQAAPPKPAPITRAQVQAGVKAQFDRLDVNHDGFVDKAEAQKGEDNAVAAREARRQAALDRMFAKLDANKDGTVSRQEFDAMLPRPQAPQGSPWLNVNDTNKDGRVSLNEVTARALAGFDRTDANHDGVITPQEAQAARRAAQAPRK